MWKKKSFFVGIGAALLFLGGCGSTAEKEKKSISGVELWGKTCNRCHNFRPATQYTDSEWEAIMDHMRIRAYLTGEDTKKIKKFLQMMNGGK